MEIEYYTEVNREAWNYVTPIHQSYAKEKWDEFFLSEKSIVQNQIELNMLKKIGIKDKNIIQLCCNNGVELLSLKNLGANKCLGIDICDLAILEAKERANKSKIDVEFIRLDVYDITEEYNESFDIVYISVGTLRWLPDIQKFFCIVNKLLKKGGNVFIYDIHPLTEIINDDRDNNQDPLLITKSYFNTQALSDENGLNYVGHSNEKGKLKYWFIHNFTDIFSAMINNNLSIRFFREYDKDISGVYSLTESQDLKLPLSYILVGEKL